MSCSTHALSYGTVFTSWLLFVWIFFHSPRCSHTFYPHEPWFECFVEVQENDCTTFCGYDMTNQLFCCFFDLVFQDQKGVILKPYWKKSEISISSCCYFFSLENCGTSMFNLTVTHSEVTVSVIVSQCDHTTTLVLYIDWYWVDWSHSICLHRYSRVEVLMVSSMVWKCLFLSPVFIRVTMILLQINSGPVLLLFFFSYLPPPPPPWKFGLL